MLKLPKLPERTPIKLTILVSPNLHRALNAYAEIYAETYGQREAAIDLIPGIILAFLEADRHFQKCWRDQQIRTQPDRK